MSQVCPSSSNQLVAAAFQKARRKFPKNYGLATNLEQTTETYKTDHVKNHDDINDQNSIYSSVKCMSSSRKHSLAKVAEEGSIEKPIVCSCCRKRNNIRQSNEQVDISKLKEDCSAGDTVDIRPNKNIKTRKHELLQSEKENPRPLSRPYFQRRSPSEASTKLDSVNLLYDRSHDRIDDIKHCGSLNEGNYQLEDYKSEVNRKDCKQCQRSSRTKLEISNERKTDNLSINPCTCDTNSVKHSSLDLLRSHEDHRRRQHHRLHYCHDYCHRECNSIAKENVLSSDSCLCSPGSPNYRRGNCIKFPSVCIAERIRNRCQKNADKISTVQEQNDEECEDCIGVINHKDSFCLLVEKYKASKKCPHKNLRNEAGLICDEINKEDCNKSLISECQLAINDDTEKGDKVLDTDSYRYQENKSIEKSWKDGRTQVSEEDNCNPFKNLKSRLIKTGNCCSAKETPWRYTF